MPSAERSVTINQPAADVFAFVADGTNGPQWRSGVVDVNHESGDGVGAVYRQRVRGPLRRKVKADYEITVYQPNRKLEFKAIAGPVRPTGGYRLSESDSKTKVTFWLKSEIGLLKRIFLGRSVRKSMDAELKSLDRLKEVLESRPAEAAAASARAAKPASGAKPKPASAAKPAAQSGAAKPKSAAPKPKPAPAKSAPARPATPRTARRRSKAS